MKYMKFICVVLSVIFLLTTQTNLYAAYTGNPSRLFPPKEDVKTFSVHAEGVADIIYDRDGKHQIDDMKVNFYGGVIGIGYKNWCTLYGGAGSITTEETFIATTEDTKVKWESDYAFAWLGGATFKLYEKELENFYNSRLLCSFDVQYRGTNIDADTITIDSVEYDVPHSDISHFSMEYNDWHVAVVCGLDMGMFSPYVGGKYSDFESCVRVTKSGTVYQKDNAEADNNFGVLIGLSIDIIDSVSASVEASFIDENSISCSASWIF